jgi:hypothetical protein
MTERAPKSAKRWPDFVFWIVLASFAGVVSWGVALELLR